MSETPVKLLEWKNVYRDALMTEILRSEARRAAILAILFAFAACVFSFFAFTPGLLEAELSARFRAQWGWMMALYAAMIAYELARRAGIRRLIRQHRRPAAAERFLNALVETSIPTLMLFMAVSFMGARDALGSPAFLLYFFFILLSILQLDFPLCLFTGLVAAVEHFLFAWHATGGFAQPEAAALWRSPVFHFSRSLILFVAGLVAGLLARQIRRQVEISLGTAEERDRAVRIFGQYVSPQIADKLLHQPVELGGELRSVCVLFLDIRNFSEYAARERPEAVMAYLNTLFDFMIDVVNLHQGIVNKFLGDGFMAVFGAPIDDAERCAHAVDASLEILKRLDRLNASGSIPPTRVGIGLHMGEAVTGNVGSSERKEYTIIGDVVNMAARLEQATKEVNACILISEAVRRTLDGKLAAQDLGAIALKGQARPARVYKVA